MPRCTFLTIITKTHTLAYSLVCVFRCKSTYLRRTNAVPPIIYCTLILFFVSILGFFCVQVWNTSYIYRLCFNLGTNRIICIFKCTYFKKHFIAVGAFIACCTLHINWFSDAHIFWTMCCAIYYIIEIFDDCSGTVTDVLTSFQVIRSAEDECTSVWCTM